MSTIDLLPPVAPEDQSARDDVDGYERVDGKLVEQNMGMESSGVGARILILLGIFLESHRLGWIFGADAAYQCFADAPTNYRKPDCSFIRFGRLPGEQRPQGNCTIAPDLAVEVVSPGDLYYEVERKVREYLDAGVRMVWVVSPSTQTVRVYRPRSSPLGPVSELTGGDAIDGEDVIPGFSCPVGEFFT